MHARRLLLPALLALAAPMAYAGALSVPMNHSVRLRLAGPAQSVVVGSPSVVDVAVVDSRTVYVSGKSPGDTDVTVIDPLGRVVFRGDVTVAGGASVAVFRGAARTDAMCAPYCHDLPADQPPATITPPTLPGMTPTTALANGTTTTMTASQTVSAAPRVTIKSP